MKYSFQGNFVQATAETLEENMMLMNMKVGAQAMFAATKSPIEVDHEVIKRRNLAKGAKKGWETRREKYGRNGHKFVGPDGKTYKHKGAYAIAMAQKKVWEAMAPEQKVVRIQKLQQGRKSFLKKGLSLW